MKDPELIELKNRFLLGIGLALLFCIPLFFFFKNRWNFSSKLVTKVKENEEIVFLIEKKNCPTCKEIEQELNRLQVNYSIINNTQTKEYDDLLLLIDIPKKEINPPTIMYIKEQKLVATLVDINDSEDIELFVDNYQLSR